LLGTGGSVLNLIAPMFTVSVLPSELEGRGTDEGGVTLLANFLPGTGPVAPGQALGPRDETPGGEAADESQPPQQPAGGGGPARVAMGLNQAWELMRAQGLAQDGIADPAGTSPKTSVMRGFLAPHPCVFRLLLKAFPWRLRFSSERVTEFLRLGLSLVS